MNTKEELVELARQIAKERGYTTLVHGLQPLEDYAERGQLKQGLKSKFVHELTEELRECVALQKDRVWFYSEAADCLYYGACIDAVAPQEQAYETALMTLAGPTYQIGRMEAEMAALAKYRLRASLPYRKHKETPEEKQIREERENQAIEAAYMAIEKWPGWPLPEVAEMYNVPIGTLYYASKNGLVPARKVVIDGKETTTLVNIKHPHWYRWYGSYRRSQPRKREDPPASTWPDPAEDERSFS